MSDIINKARDLRSVEGENPEYDRALVELTASILGLPIDEFRDSLSELILTAPKPAGAAK